VTCVSVSVSVSVSVPVSISVSVCTGNKLKTVERYDPQKDEWEMVANMGTKRWGAGVAVMENRLWVIGGMNGAERGALPTLEVYDPQVDKWEEINPGPKLARGSCTFAAI
jgi:N-acetylneuraminic acid mutarotase